MPREGIEIFHRSPHKLREYSGEEGKESMYAELPFCLLHFRLEDLAENHLHDEFM